MFCHNAHINKKEAPISIEELWFLLDQMADSQLSWYQA